MRTTRTYALMSVSPAVYAEVLAKIKAAGYDHAIDGDRIDMHGIALVPEPELEDAHDSMKEKQERATELQRLRDEDFATSDWTR